MKICFSFLICSFDDLHSFGFAASCSNGCHCNRHWCCGEKYQDSTPSCCMVISILYMPCVIIIFDSLSLTSSSSLELMLGLVHEFFFPIQVYPGPCTVSYRGERPSMIIINVSEFMLKLCRKFYTGCQPDATLLGIMLKNKPWGTFKAAYLGSTQIFTYLPAPLN